MEEKKSKNKYKIIVVLILAFVLGIFTQFFLEPVDQIEGLINNDQAIVDKIKKLTIVPSDEPAVFPVIDAAILKNTDEVIYADVQNKDVIVIYNDKAIIYRESENKIVNIVNINLDNITD